MSGQSNISVEYSDKSSFKYQNFIPPQIDEKLISKAETPKPLLTSIGS